MHRRLLLLIADSGVVLLLASTVVGLFGFGKQSDGPSGEEAEAKSRAVELIHASIAADDFVPPAVGVGRKDAAKFIAARDSGKFPCEASIEVPWERVNDDFCDCPDGSDEPGTSACSQGMFECVNRGHRALRLSSSRVGDGVCDCCDGSDEKEGLCKPSCDEASEAWINRLVERVMKADRGSARREDYARQASVAAEERVKLMEEARYAIEEVRGELDRAKETLKDLEETENAERDSKLAEAEKAIVEKTGSVELTADRLAALAVAVASAGDPLATLERLVKGVLDGEDVSVLLKGILDDGSAKDAQSARKSSGGSTPSEDEDGFLADEDDDDMDAMEMDRMDHYAGMHYDDDYAYGGYDGYDGYGDYYGHGDLDHGYGRHGTGDDGVAAEAGGDVATETGDVPVPEPKTEQEHDPKEGQASEMKYSRIIVDESDEEIEEMEEVKDMEEIEKEQAFKPPHQFKKFKYELPEAVEARATAKRLGDDVRAREKELKALEDEASTDFGEDGALWPLKDKCISAKSGGYEYAMCPFKDAHQVEGKSKTSIGKWKGIERVGADQRQPLDGGGKFEDDGGQPLLSGDVFVFDRGQKCWNGPSRTLRVALACGPEDVLSAVDEPETCAYTAVLETPAACSAHMKSDLLSGVAGTSSDAEDDGVKTVEFRNADEGVEDEL